MDDTLSTVMGLSAGAAVLAVLLALVAHTIRRERRIRAGLQEFAQQRGLRLDDQRRAGRRAARIVLSDASNGLAIDITRPQSRKSGSTTRSVPGSTRISLPDPRFAGGLAVFSGQQDPAAAAAASQLLGIFDNDLSRNLLTRMLGAEFGAHLGQLQAIDAPPGVGLTIMATADPSLQFDTAAIAAALADMPRKRETQPMILLGDEGLKLRLAKDVTDPETLSQVVDTLLALQARLR